MLLFVGLGNPGSKYENNRHNVGFMAVDAIIRRHNFSPERARWHGLASEGSLANTKVTVLKPQTFMNESGRAVGEAMRFYKLQPEHIVVFYDELDLAFGKIKAKIGGGSAGHNGIRSITAHIGPDFNRVRIGIGHPGEKSKVHNHVLGDFAKSEMHDLNNLLHAISSEAAYLAAGNTPRFLSQIALQLKPQRPSSSEHAGQEKPVDAAIKQAYKPTTKKQSENTEGPMADALRALRNGEE